MRSVCRRPIRSARPPHTKAPTIIPRYTIRPERGGGGEEERDCEREKRDRGHDNKVLFISKLINITLTSSLIRFPIPSKLAHLAASLEHWSVLYKPQNRRERSAA